MGLGDLRLIDIRVAPDQPKTRIADFDAFRVIIDRAGKRVVILQVRQNIADIHGGAFDGL